MASKKTTRRALFSSIVSLILCCAMLVGTTFAWFTDEVTSGINTINAGNLDVELYYSKVKEPATDEKNKVDGKTDLFTDLQGNAITWWEPGVVAYTNLKVANEGTLALKYQLALNFDKMNYVEYKDGSRYTLADVLKVAVVPGGFDKELGREGAYAQNYDESLASFVREGKLLAGEKSSDTFGILICWAPNDNDTDNLFNMNNGKITSDEQPLHVELGVNLFATQVEAENDSFDNTYDEGLEMPEIVAETATLKAFKEALAAGKTALLSADLALDGEDFTLDAETTAAIDLNGYTLTLGEKGGIIVDGNLIVTGNGTILVDGENTAGFQVNEGAKLQIDGGKLEVGPGAYGIYQFGAVTVNGGEITVAADGFGIDVNADTVVNFNGGSMTVAEGANGIMLNDVANGTEVNLNGGNISGEGNAIFQQISKTDIVIAEGVLDAQITAGSLAVMNIVYYGDAPVVDAYDNATVNVTKAAYVTNSAELAAAIDNASAEHLNVITLGDDITGNVTVFQKEGVNIVIDGDNYQYSGTITIDGMNRNTGKETLTIENVNFVANADAMDFLYADVSPQYAHNVTIQNCTFTNNGHNTVVPARFRQAYNITMKDCTVNGTYSPMWATGCSGITVDNVTANCTVEGFSFGTSSDVVVKNSNITVHGDYGYAVRVDASAANKLTVENSTLNAAAAVVIRYATAAYTADLNGTFNGKIIMTDNDFKADKELTPATGNLTVTVNGTPYVVTNTGLSDAIEDGKKEVSVVQDMTITSTDLTAASTDLTVNVAGGATVTVASGAAASKDLTFTGDKDSKVVLVNTNPGYEGKLSYQDNANLTFKGITFDANEISGICARGGVVTFIDCFITGELEQTIASKFVFSGCTFDVGVTQVGYGCRDVVFEDCTFETDGYGIKIYKEANENVVNLTVKNCSFKNTGSAARSAILLDHILDGFSYNITVESCKFEGYTATPTATYNKWAARMIVADSFVKTADGQYIFSYQTGEEGGSYHKLLTSDELVVTVK